jgi:hypothetical protein
MKKESKLICPSSHICLLCGRKFKEIKLWILLVIIKNEEIYTKLKFFICGYCGDRVSSYNGYNIDSFFASKCISIDGWLSTIQILEKMILKICILISFWIFSLKSI